MYPTLSGKPLQAVLARDADQEFLVHVIQTRYITSQKTHVIAVPSLNSVSDGKPA